MISVFFILSVLGLTHILVDSHLWPLPILRKQLSVLNCHQCTGFWAGALMAFLLFDVTVAEYLALALSGSYMAFLSNELIITLFDRQLND